MFEWSPVSTNVIRQSWMSCEWSSTRFPPSESVKSFDMHSW